MEFGDAVQRRRMVRSYLADPVDEAALQRILAAARSAPSAGFSQGVELVIVMSHQGRARLAADAREDRYLDRGFPPWLSKAPVHIVIAVSPELYRRRYAKPDKSTAVAADDWAVPYWWVDAGATLMAMLLAAAAEHLGAGFLGSHAFDDLSVAAGLPTGHQAIGLVTIGHEDPATAPARPAVPRRERDEIEHWEVWGGSRPDRPDGPSE